MKMQKLIENQKKDEEQNDSYQENLFGPTVEDKEENEKEVPYGA